MTRQRIIKQYGNTWVIKLEPTDVIDFGLVEGDKVDIEELLILKDNVQINKKGGKRRCQ